MIAIDNPLPSFCMKCLIFLYMYPWDPFQIIQVSRFFINDLWLRCCQTLFFMLCTALIWLDSESVCYSYSYERIEFILSGCSFWLMFCFCRCWRRKKSERLWCGKPFFSVLLKTFKTWCEDSMIWLLRDDVSYLIAILVCAYRFWFPQNNC